MPVQPNPNVINYILTVNRFFGLNVSVCCKKSRASGFALGKNELNAFFFVMGMLSKIF